MLSVVFKNKTNKDSFIKHINSTIGIPEFEVLSYDEDNLSKVYNKGLKEAKYNHIVLVDSGVSFEYGWGEKILTNFNDNPEYGVIGKVGSIELQEHCVYFDRAEQKMVGEVYYNKDGKTELTQYSTRPYDGDSDVLEVLIVDSSFMVIDKKKNDGIAFNESLTNPTVIGTDFCFRNYVSGIKLCVTFSFDITQDFNLIVDDNFQKERNILSNTLKGKLPIKAPIKILLPKTVNLNKRIYKDKLAVVIPTKGKIKMLLECVSSIFKNTEYPKELIKVFIADTGSTQEEKDEIRSYMSNNTDENIKLIEYDYYNYAQINNDAVKNHVDDSFDYILFSNNDIFMINDCITSAMDLFNKKSNVGTIGARLHYADNTIQHGGIMCFTGKIHQNP